MKKQSVVKKVISLVLVLVFCGGLGALIFATTEADPAEVIKIGGDFVGTTILRRDGSVWMHEGQGGRARNFIQIYGLGDNVVSVTRRMALRSDGTVWVWDSNIRNDMYFCSGLCDIVPVTAVRLPNINNAVSIAHDTILMADGTVWVVDFHFQGTQLNVTSFGQVSNLSNIVAICWGTALRDDGTVWTWRWEGPAERVPNLNNVIDVTQEAALTRDGRIWIWNEHEVRHGIFGTAGTSDNWGLTQIETLSDIVSISHNTAVRNDGTLWRFPSEPTHYSSDNVRQVQNLTNAVDATFHMALDFNGRIWDIVYDGSSLHAVRSRNNLSFYASITDHRPNVTSEGSRLMQVGYTPPPGQGLIGADVCMTAQLDNRTGGFRMEFVNADTGYLYEFQNIFQNAIREFNILLKDANGQIICLHLRQGAGSFSGNIAMPFTIYYMPLAYGYVVDRIVEIAESQRNQPEDIHIRVYMRPAAGGPSPAFIEALAPISPIEPRLIQEGFTPQPGTGHLFADTCMSLGSRSLSMASGAFTMDFVNAETGQLYDFHDQLDGFSIIIRDANGRTICLHLGATINGRYQDFWVGYLPMPITFYHLPIPEGYVVTRIMDRGGMSAWFGIDYDIHARVYVQPIAN